MTAMMSKHEKRSEDTDEDNKEDSTEDDTNEESNIGDYVEGEEDEVGILKLL